MSEERTQRKTAAVSLMRGNLGEEREILTNGKSLFCVPTTSVNVAENAQKWLLQKGLLNNRNC